MKLSPKHLALSLLAILSLLTTPALAAFTQPASTFSAGGGETSSHSYTNLGVVGQPAIVGTSSSASYAANHGFLSVLGDGYKILYPVISVNPGTLTFSIMAGSTGDQALTIDNTGGSTLKWTVTKDTPDTIFSFTPGSGTNAGSVTVTTDAGALTPGNYNNSLTISGNGITQSAQVLLNLTVTPSSYTLAVTLKLVTPEKGGGSVTSISAPGISCSRDGGTSDVTCQADFPTGSTVTLRQTPDSSTTWATWGAPGCGTNEDCQFVMNSNQGSDVTFPYSYMAKVLSNSYTSDSLLLAYGNAAPTDTINARAVTFVTTDDLLFTNGKTINLVGGLDAYYVPSVDAYTTIQLPLSKAVRVGGAGSRLNIKGPLKLKP